MPDDLFQHVRRQAGAVTRAQVLASGRTRKWLECRVRTGRWVRVLPCVYVTHAGPRGWRTRAWAAVLYAGPGAALAGRAAAFELGMTRRAPDVVEVAVPAPRQVRDVPGVRVRSRVDLDRAVARVLPPRTRAPETVVDLLPACRDADAVVALLCEGVRAGVHPQSVRELLVPRPRWRWRGLALQALQECEAGVESPLELRFHRDVVRRHGLPRFEAQVRERLDGWWIRADARCRVAPVRAELDGRLAHPGGRTAADTWRDNEVVIGTTEITLRYRWEHVAGAPCSTAAQVVRALRSRGWTGRARPCRPGCPVGGEDRGAGPPWRGPAPRSSTT
ncbi:hypothetical protein GCM10028777_21820 [Angustibacter speluncae]